MKMKKKIFTILLTAVLVAAMCCLAGCGQKSQTTTSDKNSSGKSQTTTSKKNSAGKSQTAASKKSSAGRSKTSASKKTDSNSKDADSRNNDYKKYDGYTYYLSNGDVKYRLATKNGYKMHCFFQSDSPEYTEVIYTMDPGTAVKSGNTLTIKKIRDGNGNDISGTFRSLTYTFSDQKVIMKVRRDESKLAGGGGDNIQSGEYVFISPSGKSSDKGDSGSGGSDSAGSGSSGEKTKYTASDLGKMAQRYYNNKNNYYPPHADVTKNSDGTFTIHLYEKVDNGDGTYHTATSAWYKVNRYGAGRNEITNEAVDISE